MRGEYSMTLLEFVLTGLTMGLALVVFMLLFPEPDEMLGWVVAIAGAILAFVCSSHGDLWHFWWEERK